MTPKPGADEWLKYAEDDLKVVEILLQGKRFRGCCFHAQQAAEKALKGFLIHSGKPYPKIHNLVRLNNLCTNINSEFYSLTAKIIIISQLFMPTQYPDVPVGDGPSQRIAYEVFDYARDIVNFCSEKIR